jgi:glucosyl-3-phosphoglycerate synthase
MLRSFEVAQFPVERVLETKRGRTVSVVLPARDEERTIGAIVEVIRTTLMGDSPVVDELVVVDDGSSDATAREAERAGATVVAATDILPEYGTEHGKGQAMWRGLHVTSGDVVAFCDSDVTGFGPGFVLGLVGPLLAGDDVGFVKGFYRRAYQGRPGEGGRVTELMARPVIALLFPHLVPFAQPLAGECAGRRDILESVPFAGGYGVDLALLIDVAERHGMGAFAQCDLGERVHRNRPLAELGPQAQTILEMALGRAGGAAARPASGWTATGRPPLAEVPAHRRTA